MAEQEQSGRMRRVDENALIITNMYKLEIHGPALHEEPSFHIDNHNTFLTPP